MLDIIFNDVEYNPGVTLYHCTINVPKQGKLDFKVLKYIDGRYSVLDSADKKPHPIIIEQAILALKDHLAALYVQSDY